MTSLQDLIAQVERAKKTVKAPWHAIGEHLGLPPMHPYFIFLVHRPDAGPAYLDACRVLQERCLPESFYNVGCDETGFSADVVLPDPGWRWPYEVLKAPTPALAWLLAILKTVEAQDG